MKNVLNCEGIGFEYPRPSSIYLGTLKQSFVNCRQINISLAEITVSLILDESLNSMYCLFCDCSDILEVKFINFNDSSITNMDSLFQNCISLTSVDLSKVNTKNIKSMRYMFFNCKVLQLINLPDFVSSSATDVFNMFSHCENLNEIDLSNFYSSKLKNLNYIFKDCKKLEYINLTNFNSINKQLLLDMLSQIENNPVIPVICIDINKAYSIYNLLNNLTCIAISCRTEWEVIRNEIKNKKCIMECNHTIKRYQYEGKCYDACPKIAPFYIFLEESRRKFFKCVPRCPLEYPFEKIETHNCVDSCNLTEREKEICQINYMPNDTNNKEVEDKELENIKTILTNGFNTSDIGSGKNLIIKQRESTITITNTENQKKPSNLTTIDLGECEKKLKDEYSIPENEPLYILKIDVKKEGLKIPKIAYEVYYPLSPGNLTKLNLTVCQDSDIKLSLPVVLSDDIDLINPSSKYYNDICYTYTSEDGTDIILSDRKFNFVNNNLTVCEEDCDFNGYNYTTRKAICSCSVKMNSTTKIGDIVFEKNKLFDSFTNFKNIANVNVLKCYKLIFKLEAFKYNYGNLILLVIIIFLFVSFFIFYFKENYDLEKILNIIVFFKLNLHLVKKFLLRKKREEQIKLNNIKKRIKNKRKAKLNDKKGNLGDLNLPPPIYSVYLKLRKKNLLDKEEVRNFDLFFENENINTNSTINNNKRSP